MKSTPRRWSVGRGGARAAQRTRSRRGRGVRPRRAYHRRLNALPACAGDAEGRLLRFANVRASSAAVGRRRRPSPMKGSPGHRLPARARAGGVCGLASAPTPMRLCTPPAKPSAQRGSSAWRRHRESGVTTPLGARAQAAARAGSPCSSAQARRAKTRSTLARGRWRRRRSRGGVDADLGSRRSVTPTVGLGAFAAHHELPTRGLALGSVAHSPPGACARPRSPTAAWGTCARAAASAPRHTPAWWGDFGRASADQDRAGAPIYEVGSARRVRAHRARYAEAGAPS